MTVDPARPTAVAPAPSAAEATGHPTMLKGMRRPSPQLMKYYTLLSIATGPGLVVMLPFYYFRYRTLRYVFDNEGVTVRWGILFRREITLTYARIQDIHLLSNVVERWLGLGRVQIQTASGSAAAEVTVEGLPDFEFVRNELYQRMRGARGGFGSQSAMAGGPAAIATGDSVEIVAALHEVASELRAIREEIEMSRR